MSFNIWVRISGAVLLLLLLFSCGSSKGTSAQKHSDKNTIKLVEQGNVKLSAFSKLVLKEINNELVLNNQPIDDYTPTEKLIKRFGLQYNNNQHYLTGTIKYNTEFNTHTLQQSGIEYGKPSGRFVTVRIPVRKLNLFFNIKGIEYFDASNIAALK